MSCCTLDYGPRYNIRQYIQDKQLFCFQDNATMQARTKVDLAAIRASLERCRESGVPWVNICFSFFCVNRITCCKVYNAA
jgi:hypothetical protein